MILVFSPQRRDDTLTLVKSGDALTINGTLYDFTQLTNGSTLPREAIGCEWVCGNVERVDGELVIPILLPHGPDATEAARFPEPMTLTADGKVVLPE